MASGVDFDLPVTLTRVSEAENGNCLVVTESDKYLAYVTLLRGQNAEIVIDEYEGLRIPKNALRVNGDGRFRCLLPHWAHGVFQAREHHLSGRRVLSGRAGQNRGGDREPKITAYSAYQRRGYHFRRGAI